MNFEEIVKISSGGMVWDMPNIEKPQSTNCRPCHEGKQIKRRFPNKEYSTSKPLDLVNKYLCGPMRTKSLQGDRHFMMLIDDYTRMTWVTFLKEKLEAFEKFKAFKALVENKTGRPIKVLRLYIGGEFTFDKYEKFYEEHMIWRQFLLLVLHNKMELQKGRTRLYRRWQKQFCVKKIYQIYTREKRFKQNIYSE